MIEAVEVGEEMRGELIDEGGVGDGGEAERVGVDEGLAVWVDMVRLRSVRGPHKIGIRWRATRSLVSRAKEREGGSKGNSGRTRASMIPPKASPCSHSGHVTTKGSASSNVSLYFSSQGGSRTISSGVPVQIENTAPDQRKQRRYIQQQESSIFR
jgi:hypothetical protein